MGVTTGVVDTAASTAVVKATGPLLYKYSGGDAMTNDGWAARKKGILEILLFILKAAE